MQKLCSNISGSQIICIGLLSKVTLILFAAEVTELTWRYRDPSSLAALGFLIFLLGFIGMNHQWRPQLKSVDSNVNWLLSALTGQANIFVAVDIPIVNFKSLIK